MQFLAQVVKHKKWGYRGVITGWDEQARAPKEWIASMHKDNPGWTTQPNYAMLVDTRDRPAPQVYTRAQFNFRQLPKNLLSAAKWIAAVVEIKYHKIDRDN